MPAVSVTRSRKRSIPAGLSWNHHGQPSLHRREVARRRRELATVGALVEGVEDECEARIVTVGIEQGP